MKYIYILSILVMLFIIHSNGQEVQIVGTNSNKQSPPDRDRYIKNLKINDKVPNLFIPKIINNNKRNVNITDFNNQLLILDFWDTYCGSCIEALPKLDSMQKIFGDRIKILTVTYQKESEVTKFFNTSRFLKGLKPACVVEDDLLRRYFKHQLISHVVWIYKGTLKALTSTEYVNAQNIQDMLDEKPTNWPVKNDDFTFDASKPIFSLNEPQKYYHNTTFNEFSGITGYREGIDVKKGIIFDDDTIKHLYRTSFMNKSIVDAYKILTFKSDTIKRKFILTPGRLILKVKNTRKYLYDPKSGLFDTWRRENSFCYEMVSSNMLKKEDRIKKVISDLNLKFNLDVGWEKRKVNCIVIFKANPSINPDTVSKPKKLGVSIVASALPLMAFDITQKFPPALDETGYEGVLYLGEYTDINGLHRELQRYGFDFKEDIREIEVLIIKERN